MPAPQSPTAGDVLIAALHNVGLDPITESWLGSGCAVVSVPTTSGSAVWISSDMAAIDYPGALHTGWRAYFYDRPHEDDKPAMLVYASDQKALLADTASVVDVVERFLAALASGATLTDIRPLGKDLRAPRSVPKQQDADDVAPTIQQIQTGRIDWAIEAPDGQRVSCDCRETAEEVKAEAPHMAVVFRIPGGEWATATACLCGGASVEHHHRLRDTWSAPHPYVGTSFPDRLPCCGRAHNGAAQQSTAGCEAS